MTDQTARYLSHAVVALAVSYVLQRVLPAQMAMLVGVLTMAAHEQYDAPLARVMSRLA